MSIPKSNLKQLLVSGELTFGSWITIGDASIAEIMANSGFDWLAVDMEHSAITLSKAEELIRVISLSGVIPLVRVADNDPCLIKRVMDVGAYGVIVPMVNTEKDAEKAVSAVKYPPEGKRSVGLARAQGYGLSFEKYKNWLDKESIVVVQIEHIEAVENLEKILKVRGVDASIIGPYDLSASLGYPGEFERLELKSALKKYEDICVKLKKPRGIHAVPSRHEEVLKYIKKGYRFVAFSFDALFLGSKCKEELRKVVAEVGRLKDE